MPTLLFGGLTDAHDRLYQAAFHRLGYDALKLPPADNESLVTGRVYCNKGQCNPIYYTAGSLIRFLQACEERGEKDVQERYAYITAGSCGPCRFGMYEMEYRRALRNAGFPRVRVIALQQGEAMVRDLEDVGFSIRRRDFFALLKPLILGDLLNDLYYQVRPYETAPGATDRWRERSLALIGDSLRRGRGMVKALRRVRGELGSVVVDYLTPKPKVSIIGEFFSHIQEGDPSYRLPGWLIEEGAEPELEYVTTWIDYLIWAKRRRLAERAFRSRKEFVRLSLLIGILQTVIHLHFFFFRLLLGRKPRRLPSQWVIARLAHRYYNTALAGGEGHLEVGKHIHAVSHGKAHMILSIKPFGCMPSTQSDGVQMKVMEDLEGSLFVSVDTSGDAEINVKSRIMMTLHEARARAEEEFEECRQRWALTGDKIERGVRRRPRVTRGFVRLPGGCVSTAARALRYISRPGRGAPAHHERPVPSRAP
jgi:predicted nucleotide-binding protein (sugar kinase/HSP70/actin superfamily)